MSDLRARIETALFDACCRFDVPDSERRDMADAVIRELEPELKWADRPGLAEYAAGERVSSDWLADDE